MAPVTAYAKSMTLDDLKRQKRHSCRNKKKFYGVHQTNLSEVRPILSVVKCRPMILVSRNVKYMRIFAGVPREGGVNFQTTTCLCLRLLL